MNAYEREYFVSRIRCGFYLVEAEGHIIKVMTPTLEDMFYASEVFQKSMQEAIKDGFKTEDEMLEWMREKELWTTEDDKKVKELERNLENLKAAIYNERKIEVQRETRRAYIRHTEKALKKLSDEKNTYFSRTCEAIALQDKSLETFKRTCYIDDKLFDLDNIDINLLYYNYNQLLLDEKQIRELSRTDPWSLIWSLRDQSSLFQNETGRELSNDQRGLVMWSKMYENIQESMDCPTPDVMEDDDLLDGWIIVQQRKAKSDKAKQELEVQNEKIGNSDEILIMADSSEKAETIHSLNSFHADTIRKQRLNTVKARGGASDTDFKDRRLEIVSQQNQMFKDTARRS